MKVNIGNYRSWFGPYQLVESIFFWTKFEYAGIPIDYPNWVYSFGEYLSNTWIGDFLEWRHQKKKRKIEVTIDSWDCISLDHTLALIICPALKQFKANRMGHPIDLKDEFVDENLSEVENWERILDEMIFAFESIINDDWEWEYDGVMDIKFEKQKDGYSKMVNGPNHTYRLKTDKILARRKRVENGLRLFAKYYRNLWT